MADVTERAPEDHSPDVDPAKQDPSTEALPDDDLEVAAPGWDAIDAVLSARYGTQAPTHVGYDPPPGVSNNLQGCSAYRAAGHWHYVSYGLSELYEADPGADPAVSGWGLELTLRVAGEETQPPEWPFVMINEIAKQVNRGTMRPAPGGRIDLRAPITGFPNLPDAPQTALTVYAVTTDPELGEIDTPNGRLAFLQLIGTTAAEKERMLATSTAAVLAELADDNPLLVTDPERS